MLGDPESEGFPTAGHGEMPPASGSLDRRRFLTLASAWALFLGAHGGASAAGAGRPSGRGDSPSAPRIRSLRLRTSTPLGEMREFYAGKIGFPLLRESAEEVTFRTGASRITFAAAPSGTEAPFYHFAFNIPENKILLARQWQVRRSALLVAPGHLRDPSMPKDVIHFRHWNAHSIFFWDPAGNIVEYIARHDLDNGAPGAFGLEDLLHASEIGLITDDVPALAAELRKAFGLEPYRSGSDRFLPLGDELGLLLVVRKGRKWGWGPQRRAAEIFPTAVGLRGSGVGPLRPAELPYEIRRGPLEEPS